MAVAFVQNWTGVGETDGSTAISGTALTAGNWAVVSAKVVLGATITPPSPFTSVLSVSNASRTLEVFIGKSVGGETSFTFTETGTDLDIALSEFTNIAASSPVDVTASTTTANGTSCGTGTTAATSMDDEMAIALVAWNGSVTSPSCATGFTLGSKAINAGPIRTALAYKVLSATGTQTGTWSWTTSRTSCSAIITLKGLSGAVGPLGPGKLVGGGILQARLVG